MNVKELQQVSIADLRSAVLDGFLAFSGYESRGRDLAERLWDVPCSRKVAVAFGSKEKITKVTRYNDKRFEKAGFVVIRPEDTHDADETTNAEVRQFLDVLLARKPDGPLSIIVDYSSMSRRLLAVIIEYLRDSLSSKTVCVYFSYTPYKFSKPNKPIPNEIIGPLPGFSTLQVPSRDTALVIGLGHTAKRGLGLLEYVDPSVTYAFYTDPALDPRYIESIKKSNEDILTPLQYEDCALAYPADDLESTYSMLASLVMGLRTRYRVILAPIGPKPFALLSLLMAAQVDDLDVWRVSSGPREKAVDRRPNGMTFILKVTFQGGSA